MTEKSGTDRRRITRREFLGVSTGAAVGGIVAAGVIGGIAGYLAGQSAAPPRAVTTTVTQAAAERTVTVQRTATVERTVTAPQVTELKVGYIYVGPVGDYGWSHAHDQGRKWADQRFPAAKSAYIESVPEPQAASAIESLITKENAK
ncbi:MAG: hypothetical protein QW410_06195, partial [Nitrososphaerota archaeon]